MVDLGPLSPWLPPTLPWPPVADWVQVTSLLNEATGEFISLPGEIHREDLDWLCRSWQPVLEMEWRVRSAGWRGAGDG